MASGPSPTLLSLPATSPHVSLFSASDFCRACGTHCLHFLKPQRSGFCTHDSHDLLQGSESCLAWPRHLCGLVSPGTCHHYISPLQTCFPLPGFQESALCDCLPAPLMAFCSSLPPAHFLGLGSSQGSARSSGLFPRSAFSFLPGDPIHPQLERSPLSG